MNEQDYHDWMNEQDYHDWKKDHRSGLEEDFLNKQCPPILDDDIPDFLDDNADEFEAYAKDRYNIERDLD